MGVVSRYFERLIAILRPRRAAATEVSVDAKGLRIGAERVAWRDVRRVDAYKRDIFSGNLFCLAILAAPGGRLFEINEESPGWMEAGDAIERYLPGALPRAEWTMRLIAANPGEYVEIFPVGLLPLNSAASRQGPPR